MSVVEGWSWTAQAQPSLAAHENKARRPTMRPQVIHGRSPLSSISIFNQRFAHRPIDPQSYESTMLESCLGGLRGLQSNFCMHLRFSIPCVFDKRVADRPTDGITKRCVVASKIGIWINVKRRPRYPKRYPCSDVHL